MNDRTPDTEIPIDPNSDATQIKIADHVEGHLPDAPEKEIKHRVFILKPGFAYNPWTKWPRNLSCPCGSGHKFKKCHFGRMSHAIEAKDAKQAQSEFDQLLKLVSELKSKGQSFIMPKQPDQVEPTP